MTSYWSTGRTGNPILDAERYYSCMEAQAAQREAWLIDEYNTLVEYGEIDADEVSVEDYIDEHWTDLW